MSRFGGLRCPSEHLALTWGDVDFEGGRVVVRSPKTEHYDGKETRIIPLFPELRPYLQAAYDELLADFDPKLQRLSEQPVITRSRKRDSNSNLRTHLNRIITKAGVKPWPKLFQNLRSKRQTELEERFPTHVVCALMGNSPRVAAKHYLQMTDEHFDRALTNPLSPVSKPMHKPLQSDADTDGRGDIEGNSGHENCVNLRRNETSSDFHENDNTPGRIRTCDLRIRSPLLYPAELRALCLVFSIVFAVFGSE